jgi:serine/threonine protein kinase
LVLLHNHLNPTSSTIKIGKLLGEGTFENVNEANWLGTKFIVKIFTMGNVGELQREVAIFSQLSHPSIIPLIRFF